MGKAITKSFVYLIIKKAIIQLIAFFMFVTTYVNCKGMKIRLIFHIVLVSSLLVISGCISNDAKPVEVRLTLHSGANQKVLLEQIPLGNEQQVIIDSAVITDGNKEVLLHIPPGEERLFRIRIPDSNVQCVFINDASEIVIDGNYINAKCTVSNSRATALLKQFTDNQQKLAQKNYLLQQNIDRIIKINPSYSKLDSLKKQSENDRVLYFKRYIQFADTVQSPALFIAVYNNIEFGKDYTSMESFINKASSRFPSYRPVQELKKDIQSLVKIFTEEFKVGDQLPSISLPDKNGNIFSTASLQGKYYLLDFWSTWCPQCLVYNPVKKQAWQRLSAQNFEIVSVAIDAEKDEWQKIISKEAFAWPQLIDVQMWKGTAVNTLKFDSIPFNFLVSPSGRIIRKAIAADSLIKVVSAAIRPSPE